MGTTAAPLELEPYATLCAEMDASGIPKDELLDREGLSPEEWAKAQAYWQKRMADEAARKQFRVTTRYQNLFKTKRKLFESAAARRERLVTDAAPPLDAVHAAQEALAVPIPSALPQIDVPSPPAVVAPPPLAPRAPDSHPVTDRTPNVAPFAALPFGGGSPPAYAAPPAAAAPPPVVAPLPPAAFAAAPSPALVPVPAYMTATAPPPASVAPQTLPVPPQMEQPAPVPRRASTMIVEPEPQAPSAVRATPFQVAAPLSRAQVAALAPPGPHADQAGVASMMSKAKLGSTMSVDAGEVQAALRAILPFDSASAGQVPAPAWNPAPAASPQAPGPIAVSKPVDLGSTMIADLDAFGPALPFAGRPAGSPPAPPPPAAPPPAPPPDDDDDDDAGRTRVVQAPAVGPAVPFASAARPNPGIGSTQPIPPFVSFPDATNSGGLPDDDDDDKSPPKTAMFDAAQLLAQALPFAGGEKRSPSSPAVVAQRPSPMPSPAVNPAAAGPRRFPINVFASITAEIAEHPDQVDAIRARYGISEAEHHAESQAWTQEFEHNDDMRKRYFGIVARYRGYLQQRK